MDKAVDFSNPESWVHIANSKDGKGNWTPKGFTLLDYDNAKCDVFCVHPTFILGYMKSELNARLQEKSMLVSAEDCTKYVASAFNGCCRVYAPHYRMITVKAYAAGRTPAALTAWEAAYKDVKAAFVHFLNAYCTGDRPFILAGHSQGANHLARLCQEMVDRDDHLQSRMVCAYLLGSAIGLDTFQNIPPSSGPLDLGCFVTWATASPKCTRCGSAPGLKSEKQLASLTERPISINPLSWNTSNDFVSKESHRGALKGDSVHPGQTGARCTNRIGESRPEVYGHEGTLTVDRTPFIDSLNYLGDLHKDLKDDLHAVDVSLWWLDIRENSEARVKAWLAEPRVIPPVSSMLKDDMVRLASRPILNPC